MSYDNYHRHIEFLTALYRASPSHGAFKLSREDGVVFSEIRDALHDVTVENKFLRERVQLLESTMNMLKFEKGLYMRDVIVKTKTVKVSTKEYRELHVLFSNGGKTDDGYMVIGHVLHDGARDPVADFTLRKIVTWRNW